MDWGSNRGAAQEVVPSIQATPLHPHNADGATPHQAALTRAVVVRGHRRGTTAMISRLASRRGFRALLLLRGRSGGHLKLVEVDAASHQLVIRAALGQAPVPQYQDVVGSWQVLQLVRDQDAGRLQEGQAGRGLEGGCGWGQRQIGKLF